MTTNGAMSAYYAARAKEYDAVYAKPERQTDLRRIEEYLPPFFSGKRVLEVACGTGYWTQFYAPLATRVVATDSVEETLAIARQRGAPSTVDFLIADAFSLPKSLGTFDAAFAGFWLSHVSRGKVLSFLEGLHSRLLPGATVVFLDNLYIEGSSTPIAGDDNQGNTYQIRKLKDGTFHRILKNFPSSEELEKAIDGIGVKAQYRFFDYYWVFSYQTI